MIHDRQVLNGPVLFAEYGSANRIDQSIEYCTIFCDLFSISRQELKQIYDKMIKANHGIVDPALVWKFRSKLAGKISDPAPAYRRSWYAWGDISGQKKVDP